MLHGKMRQPKTEQTEGESAGVGEACEEMMKILLFYRKQKPASQEKPVKKVHASNRDSALCR
jgi:hypothetical protein